MINELFRPTLEWIRDDWRSHPFRFMVEIVAWAISIGCSITILYPIWIAGCAMYAWAAHTRKSFGMLANYLLLVTIDTVGLIRML
jgi:uncharacterized membrane protein